MRNVAGILMTSLLGIGAASANVSIKNGNFFIGYTDVAFPGGFEPKIERVYNSKSPFKGVFGWGWGSEFEVFLAVREDGSIVVHEYGGGADNVFRSGKADPSLLTLSVQAILEAAEKNHDVSSDTEMEELRKELIRNQTFRHEKWDDYVGLGFLKRPELPVGLEFTSNQFTNQVIRCERGGLVRSFENGRTEYFNTQGKLIRVADNNRNHISFDYDAAGHLRSFVDNFGRRLEISINSQGLVERVLDVQRNRSAVYKYNDRSELVYSKDVDGNEFEYQYDSPGRHNMVRIGYSDKTSLEIEYYSSDQHENVKSVTDRDRSKTGYEYITLGNKDNYAIQVTVTNDQGKVLTRSRYEYTIGRDVQGHEYTAKLKTTIDGDETETEYDGDSTLPLAIRSNGQETRFQYDVKGHVTRKQTPDEITEMAYDSQSNKVTFVKKYPLNRIAEAVWSKFRYDAKGNLVFAENSGQKTIKLEYDENGRIHDLITKDGSRIRFTYNQNSKPTEIALVKADNSKQSILVEYDVNNEIKKVDSPNGANMALKVTTAFQELLDIIRPAGVNLSF